jgi:hypothetical protein
MPAQLNANQQLNTNDHLDPANERTKLIMQSDGNLVLYRQDNGKALWASNTWDRPVTHAIMQTDGNFVCYDANGRPYWATGTNGHPGAYVLLQDDGNLVVYNSGNAPLWASNTVQNWPVNGAGGQVVPKFPFSASQDDSFSGSGGVMHTDVTVYANGLLNAVTHSRELTALRGFKGVAAAAVLDENKAKLWVSDTQPCGVDGSLFGTSDRTINWNANIPAPILPSIRYIAIIQQWNPNGIFNDIENWLNGIGDVAKQLGPIIQAVETIGAAL